VPFEKLTCQHFDLSDQGPDLGAIDVGLAVEPIEQMKVAENGPQQMAKVADIWFDSRRSIP